MPQLTHFQQYYRTIYLGASFFFMYSAISTFRNVVSQLFDEYGLQGMGQISMIFSSMISFVSCFFSSYFIKKLGYQKVMFLSGVAFLIFVATSFIIITKIPIADPLKWIIVMFGASISGIGEAIVWTSQGSYISQVSDPTNKTQLFGLFWGFNESGKVFANLVVIFVLGELNNNLMFSSIIALFIMAGSCMLLFLPNASLDENSQEVEDQQPILKEEAGKIVSIIRDSRYRYLKVYYFTPGIILSFYIGYLYKLVEVSLPQEKGQETQDYNSRLKFYSGLVLLTLTLGSAITGFLMNRFSQRFNAFKLPVVSTLIVEAAAFFSLTCYFTQLLPLCFGAAYLWGTAFSFTTSNIGALISKVFPGRVEGYSVMEGFFNLLTAIMLFLGIVLSSISNELFLGMIVMIQIGMTGMVQNIYEMETKVEREVIQDEEQNS